MIAILAVVAALAIAGCAPSYPAAGGGSSAPQPVSQTTTAAEEEVDGRAVVEAFGERLKGVSLLGPDAAQQIGDQYGALVSAGLLDEWANDPSKAPGRLVSSPWPDRIEITGMRMAAEGKYGVTGAIVEVTSVEVVNGVGSARIPVRIAVDRLGGKWRITEYRERQ